MFISRLVEGSIRRAARSFIRLSVGPFPQSEYHMTRFFMYRHLGEVLRNSGGGEVLCISGSHYLLRLLSDRGIHLIEANYPECSILDLPFEDNRFDYVVSDMVLEHVEGDPFKAIDETHRVLKPGGIAIHTSCFMYQRHGYPGDFWRFTPDALSYMCRNFAEVIDVGGWGNRYYWLLSWLGAGDVGIPKAGWHPVHKLATINEVDYPISTWVVAKK